ncbi:Ig-like domain-containing protein [Anaerococcus vaginimassiliensis]|uniref:Ig-like domain-containing protein n=1 Tax=Anaerococcus vaginimassiliensis TaxID=2042308 RepID=UPI0013EF0990|nr:Ig-like domain-containing protein [Anaerococcus vaginimassiliensis]
MKRRLKDFTVKLFSLILAITMCIPTNVYALADDSEEEMPTIMRLDEDSESGQTEETSDSEDIPTISEEDRNNYDISYDAKLSDSFDSIIYTIKVSKKEESIHDPEKTMTLALATNKNQSLTDLHIDEVRDLEEGEVDYSVDKEEEGNLHTCAITTPTAKKGVEYTIKAPIAKDAIDTEKLYSLDMSVDIGDVNIDLKRISYKFMEEASEDNPEEVRLVLTNIKEVDDAFQKIAYNKSDEEDKADTLVYTDYLISKDKQDEASISERKNEVSYKLILDENQDPSTAKIALDYFKANDKGFVLQKEFSTEIAYQEDLTLDVPAGYLLKLTYTNQADKTKTKVENYSVNNRQVKNPRFVKEEEKKEDEEEDPAPAEKEEPSKKEEKAKEPTNLEKADAELKKALADPKNTITEIQALLDTFEKKYNLSQADQEKLMTDNDAAIKALVEKDRKENTRLNNLRQEPARAPSNDFSNKLFHLNLDMNVKASPTNPIPAGWYFDVQLGSYLKEDIGQQLKDLTDENGRFVAYATYNKESHTIRYKFIRDITSETTLTVDQYLGFDTTNIGNKESIDINIKVAPKNNPVQSMDTITVKKDAPSPVESSYKVEEQGPTTEITYPYQLSYETKPSLVKDSKDNEINNGADLNGAYVEWNIEVDTSTINSKSDLEYNKLNLTVFGSNKQGLKNFKFKAATDEADLDKDGGYRSSADTKELLFQNSLIDKKDIGDKLYIRVKGYIDPNHPHPEYSIGFRINPDNNYVTNMLKDIQDKFNSLPTPLKWLEGVGRC